MHAKQLTIGQIYKVVHHRKGSFYMLVNRVDGEWIGGTIVKGKAEALCYYNIAEAGEEITVRDCLCDFYPVPASPGSVPSSRN